MLRFLYHTSVGRMLLKILCQPYVSRTVGRFLDSKASVFLIPIFVRKNNIDLNDFESDDFKCFNDCFCRRIKIGRRPIDEDPKTFIAPCDALLSVYRVNDMTVLPIKQSHYSLPDLLQDDALAQTFCDGYCMVYRLCVNHYHRYCYFDDAKKGDNIYIPGLLHTVRPIALSTVPVFVQNSREYTVLDTIHFGKAVQMEVGAMLVGKIKNLHGKADVKKGEEKGYFLYGGSTIIVLLKKDSVSLTDVVLSKINTGEEIPVRMGETLGYAVGEVSSLGNVPFSSL